MPDDLHPFVYRLFGRRPAEPEPKPDRPRTATRIRELEKALAHAHERITVMQKRADLAEARARETLKFAMWGGGKRQG